MHWPHFLDHPVVTFRSREEPNVVYRRDKMNVANCRQLLSLFVYCGVAVLVIVNGQSTTDDETGKDEVSRDTVEALIAEFRAEMAKSTDTINSLKSQLTVSLSEIAKLKKKGKDKTISYYKGDW